LLGEEIDALGYKRRETIDGRVFFTGDENAAARCNIWLRHAERLYIEVGSCTAESFSDLFDGVAAMPWENYIGYDDKFPVRGHSIKSKLFSVPDCQKIIKKSIASRLLAAHRVDVLIDPSSIEIASENVRCAGVGGTVRTLCVMR
jgi:putative N6-adenine-specific DNA methylase